MKFNVPVPLIMNHLKIDVRGYPIPFFVAYVNGIPDFRLLDAHKQKLCVDKKLCAVCGKKLFDDGFFFIGGIMTLTNGVSSDPAMHRQCAEFSLQACPHLYLQKADRNERGEEYTLAAKNDKFTIPEKPKEIYLIKSDKYKFLVVDRQPLIRFRVKSYELYTYTNGTLSKNEL